MIVQKLWEEETLEGLCVTTIRECIDSYSNKIASKDKKFLEKIIRERNLYKKEDIAKALLLYTAFWGDKAIVHLRKKGVFRYKSYGGEESNAFFYLETLIDRIKAFNLSLDSKKYLTQKSSCRWLEVFYRDTENTLRKAIRKHHHNRKSFSIDGQKIETTLYLELLSYLEMNFRKERIKKQNLARINKDLYINYEKEEISEAVSLLIYLYEDEIGIKENRA